MDLSRRAALRATLSGLHAGAVLAGTECVLVWAAFRWTPAAIVGGFAYVVGGVFALLAYPRAVARTRRVILMRGLRVYVYSVALITAGALLVRSGSRSTGRELQATGMTWLTLRGEEPSKLMAHAGHEDFKMTKGHIRKARSRSVSRLLAFR